MAEDFPNRTPGELLRAAREARGVDLATAHEGTKIPLRLIEAMERDEYHKLSGPLYVRSFLRNYAGWLGLDAEEILRVYELATGRPETPQMTEEMVWTEDEVSVRRVGVPWLRLTLIAVGVVAGLLVLVWLGMALFGGGRDRDETAGPPQQQPRTVAIAEEPAPAPAQEPEPARVQPELGPERGAETPEERLARLQQYILGGVEEQTEATAAPAAEAADHADLAPPPRGDSALRFTGGATFPLVLRVVLPAPTNCTVRRDGSGSSVPVIWPDDPGPVPAYNVRAGLAYAVRGGFAVYWGAEDNFTLSLDDLRGAQVTLNGQPQDVDRWRPGQAVVLDRFLVDRDGG